MHSLDKLVCCSGYEADFPSGEEQAQAQAQAAQAQAQAAQAQAAQAQAQAQAQAAQAQQAQHANLRMMMHHPGDKKMEVEAPHEFFGHATIGAQAGQQEVHLKEEPGTQAEEKHAEITTDSQTTQEQPIPQQPQIQQPLQATQPQIQQNIMGSAVPPTVPQNVLGIPAWYVTATGLQPHMGLNIPGGLPFAPGLGRGIPPQLFQSGANYQQLMMLSGGGMPNPMAGTQGGIGMMHPMAHLGHNPMMSVPTTGSPMTGVPGLTVSGVPGTGPAPTVSVGVGAGVGATPDKTVKTEKVMSPTSATDGTPDMGPASPSGGVNLGFNAMERVSFF